MESWFKLDVPLPQRAADMIGLSGRAVYREKVKP